MNATIHRALSQHNVTPNRPAHKAAAPTPTAEEAGPQDTVELSSAAQGTKAARKRSPRRVVSDAMKTGEPQRFKNSLGKTSTIQVHDYGTSATSGAHSYYVQVGKDRFMANIDPNNNKRDVLTSLTDLFSQQPRAVRAQSGNFTVKNGPSPYDEADQKRLNDPKFHRAAEASGNQVTFYQGSKYLNKYTFDHEVAHNFAGSVDRRRVNPGEAELEAKDFGNAVTPEGYEKAARSDRNDVSAYAHQTTRETGTYGEDFADFYAAYSQAKVLGPEYSRGLRDQYPDRFAFTKNLLSQERTLLQQQEAQAAQPQPGYGFSYTG